MFVPKNSIHQVAPLVRRQVSRRALTLIEVMIATTLTLLILLALTASFKKISDAVSVGRSRITLSDELRGMLQLLNSDLEMRTVGGQTPENFGSGRGYFKYLDGGMSDWTAAVVNSPVNSPTTTPLEQAGTEFKKQDLLKGGSRWGDVDDVLMFTAQAKDGQLFRGKVPRALMMFANWNRAQANGDPLPPLPTDADWAEDIAISSEFAEIVWFSIPLNLTDSGVYEPSTPTILTARGQMENFLPRRMALCRRVLLVRPDLDITPPPAVRNVFSTDVERLYYVQPPNLANQSLSLDALKDAVRGVNANANRRCDLSITVKSIVGGNGDMLCYKTNSLSDLQDPQNRFAHASYPITNNQNLVGATLPLMTLTDGINALALPVCRAAVDLTSPGVNPTFVPNGGFVPPFFMRFAYRRVDPTDWRTWVPNATLQEMVTPDLLAFDLKAFDPSAPVLLHPGPDSGPARRQNPLPPTNYGWGVAFVDDNNNNITDEPAEAGWFGSDDVTVDPSQPGFWTRLADSREAPIEIERGAYVDLGWAFRGNFDFNQDLQSLPDLQEALAVMNRASFLVSEFSGVTLRGGAAVASPFLIHGGAIALPGLANHSIASSTVGSPTFVFQNAFDTYTTQYDSDGEQDGMGPMFGIGNRFRFSRRALGKYGRLIQPSFPFDQDPIGVDVPPAYPSELRSIQATIRIQDKTAQAIQQISVIHSLVD